MSNDLEFEEMMARHVLATAERARQELSNAASIIASFANLAAKKGITLNINSFEYVQTIGIVASAPRLTSALLGPIKVERDGLLAIADIESLLHSNLRESGYFVGSDFMLMAHPCFRRQMHPKANWAPRFLDLLWGLNQSNINKYIAIDEHRVRINVDSTSYVERDTWFGAPYNDDVRQIKNGIVKLRPPINLDAHHVQFFFANAYSLDIKWSELDGIKTFQALEFKTNGIQTEIDEEIYFPARYLHAEFDIAANCFRHFDGAIQYFLEEEYLQRRDADFNMTSKNAAHIKARSKKVFKLNGHISTSTWVEFCCHFFAANPLTFEYFTGQYPKHVSKFLAQTEAKIN